MFIPTLLENLEKQRNLHHLLRDKLQEELGLEASCFLEDLEKLQYEKEEIASQLKILEEQRQTLTQEHRQEFTSTPMLLKEIIAKSDAPFKEKLAGCYEDLKQVLLLIRQLTKRISQRSMARLTSLRKTQQNISLALRKQMYYSSDGTLRQTAGSHFIQQRV